MDIVKLISLLTIEEKAALVAGTATYIFWTNIV